MIFLLQRLVGDQTHFISRLELLAKHLDRPMCLQKINPVSMHKSLPISSKLSAALYSDRKLGWGCLILVNDQKTQRFLHMANLL